MNIKNGPQAAVVCAGIVAAAAVVITLIRAGWDAETIAGLVAAIGAIVTGQTITTRRAAVVEAKTDQQTETLAKIDRQTNGELRAVVSDAVQRGIAAGVAQAAGQLPADERRI